MRRIGHIRFARADLIQFVEYLIGGTSYFWSGYAVFAVFYSGLGWNWFPAKMLADVAGWSVNYIIQRYWAFNKPQLAKHEGITAGKYILLTACNLVLDYLIIWMLDHIGISPYAGFFVSAIFFTGWNYLWYRFWVFSAKTRVELKEVK